MTEIRTLRPGLLVSLNTTIRGNIHYQTIDLEKTHLTPEGEQRARWETERIVTDPVEYEAATKLRNTVGHLIRQQCAKSAFGLLCPESNMDALTDAIAQARKLTDEFNDSATLTRVSVNVIYGRIAQDDVEAIRAISSEIRTLMEDMQDGLQTLNVKAVRDACNKAKSIGEMLSEDAKGRLEVAISAARNSARKIVKAGETVALEIDKATIAKIDVARTSFLDIDADEGEIAAPDVDVRGIDMEED